MYLSIGDEFPSMVLKGLTANKTFDDVDVTSVEGWKVIY